jgi:MFS family permease
LIEHEPFRRSAMSNVDALPVTTPAQRAFAVAGAYRIYVTALIWIVLVLRFVDLQIISILFEPIKAEFAISDTQLGFLSGFAFALLYGVLGVPVAWLADRYNRRNIIAAAIGLWSAMTAFCGLAPGFISLALARAGVGVGEAGGTPPSYSLISDYFPAEKRATVFAVLNSAVPFGIFLGLVVGGWVAAEYGWRAAFIAVGLPGVLVALLVRLTVREAPRGHSDQRAVVAAPTSIRETLGYLWSLKSYRHLVLATSIFTLGAMGSGIWIPSFFIRVHGMAGTEVAVWLGTIYGAGGMLGVLIGGLVCDRLVRRTGDKRWYAWQSALATACILPFSFFVYLWPHAVQALLVHVGTTILMYSWMGPAYGIIQSLAGIRQRAMAAAINLLTVNLIAYGMGPLIVGMASDFFGARYGSASLRYSILSVVVVAYSWAAFHFYRAARTLREDLQRTSARESSAQRSAASSSAAASA